MWYNFALKSNSLCCVWCETFFGTKKFMPRVVSSVVGNFLTISLVFHVCFILMYHSFVRWFCVIIFNPFKTNCFVILSDETLKHSQLKPYIKQSHCGYNKIRTKRKKTNKQTKKPSTPAKQFSHVRWLGMQCFYSSFVRI